MNTVARAYHDIIQLEALQIVLKVFLSLLAKGWSPLVFLLTSYDRFFSLYDYIWLMRYLKGHCGQVDSSIVHAKCEIIFRVTPEAGRITFTGCPLLYFLFI